MLLPFTHTWTVLLAGILASVLIMYGAPFGTPLRGTLKGSPGLLLSLASLVLALLLLPRGPDGVVYFLTVALGLLLIPLVRTLYQHYRHQLVLLIVFILTWHGLWGIAQFSFQADLGQYLLGETQLVPGQPGLATFSVHKFFRAYGPYPHPNILGGLLALGLLLLIRHAALLRLAPVRYLFWLLTLASVLTFSRSAWLASGLAITSLLGQDQLSRTLRWRVVSVMLLVFLTLVPLVFLRLTDSADRATSERQTGYQLAGELWHQTGFIKGVGLGNYVPQLAAYLEQHAIIVEPWEIAPVHSAPVLLLIEWGWLLGGTFIAGLVLAHQRLFHQHWWWLVPLLPLLLLDHYAYTNSAVLLLLLSTGHLLGSPSARYTS